MNNINLPLTNVPQRYEKVIVLVEIPNTMSVVWKYSGAIPNLVTSWNTMIITQTLISGYFNSRYLFDLSWFNRQLVLNLVFTNKSCQVRSMPNWKYDIQVIHALCFTYCWRYAFIILWQFDYQNSHNPFQLWHSITRDNFFHTRILWAFDSVMIIEYRPVLNISFKILLIRQFHFVKRIRSILLL